VERAAHALAIDGGLDDNGMHAREGRADLVQGAV
jgi:hypothetical protein